MVSPTPKPTPPQPRIKKQLNTNPTSQPKLEKETPKIDSKPTNGKLSLYSRYNALPFKLKLYLWITTAGVAWLADSVSDRIFQQNMIEEEANRRVEMEIRKMKEAEILLNSSKK